MSSLVQYIVVRGDLMKNLSWPLGAVIAQCCHAVTAISHLHAADEDVKSYFADLDNMHKVVLEAPTETDLIKLSETLDESKIVHKLWIEQPENFPTCIAIKPYPKDVVHKYVKRFKLMK